MQLDLKFYKESWMGTVSYEEYPQLASLAEMIVESFVQTYLSNADLAPLSEIRGDYRKALCAEIDFLHTVGGVDAAFGGQNQADLKTVKTENFEYSYSERKQRESDFNGMPLSPIARSLILSELRKQGYLSLKVKQCLRREC